MVGGAAALLAGCAPEKARPIDPTAPRRLRVVATTTMIGDLVRQVGGEDIELTVLMGPGTDPHLYKSTAADAGAIKQAQLLFYNGLHLEGRMIDVLEKQGDRAVALGDHLRPTELIRPTGQAHPDPHIWGDPRLWMRLIAAVEERLMAADSVHAEAFRTRATAARAQMQSFITWCQTTVETLPPAQRVLVTSHDAFSYFGRAFGFTVIGVQGISTVSEAGLGEVQKVTSYIRDHRVRAIFVESSVSRDLIDRISHDSGAKVGGELFSDSLGTRGETFSTPGQTWDKGTYTGMIAWNVWTAVQALRADGP
jgi:manganese/zinc/iron transport system substrate-binding protein